MVPVFTFIDPCNLMQIKNTILLYLIQYLPYILIFSYKVSQATFKMIVTLLNILHYSVLVYLHTHTHYTCCLLLLSGEWCASNQL